MFIPESIQQREDYQACVSFHGHTCMGVTIGYLAAKFALDRLGEMRAIDEELIVIVETDACCCDAIQVLTGCTFGKGNFFHLDYGKMAFTFGSRSTGRGVRLILKPEIFSIPEQEQQLATKIRRQSSSTEEQNEHQRLYEQRGRRLFSSGPAGFFTVQQIRQLSLPAKAPRAQSTACSLCGEMVMETKLELSGGHLLCRACMAER
jgi:formylmethanofuran dehydrogenase subunit E